ncbi:MAG: hypothetical protein M3066_21190 [Actinomycetota bacterium]|nr:hypothetical protein [Actinomycetota bacterium]
MGREGDPGGPIGGVARVIRAQWEPALMAVLVVGFVAALLLGAWASYAVWGATWLAAMVVVFIVLLRLVSTRFSRSVLRMAAFASVVIAVGGVLSVGRAERVDAARVAARAAATHVLADAAALQRDPAFLPTSEARAQARAAVDALKARPGVSDPSTLPGQIVVELDRGLAADRSAAAVQKAAALQAQLPADPPPSTAAGARPALTTQLAEAVDSVRGVVAATQVDAAVGLAGALCAEGEGTLTTGPVVAGTGSADEVCTGDRSRANAWDRRPVPDRHAVAVHQADAALALAQAGAAAARGPAVEPARQLVVTRQKAVADARTGGEARTPDAPFLDVLSQGGNAVVRRLPLVDRRGVPLALAMAGWLLVAGLGIVAYRHFEIINGTDGLGPVRVNGTGADAERFRTYLLWNIGEPGAVPGASALKPVTDLLGAGASGVPGAAWLQRLLEAITAALAIDHGYTVEFDVLEEATDAAGATVTVRVHVARTGQLVGQHVAIRPTKKEAERSAAYWSAALILSRSRKVPGWASWSKETSDSLAAYFQASDEGAANIDRLREAVEQAPMSGLLSLELANAEAIAGHHFRTFQLALRVATIHPRYIAGRYRMALTASILAADLTRYWDSRPRADRDVVVAALERYGPRATDLVSALRAADALAARGVTVGDDRANQFCRFALAELERLRGDTGALRVAGKALRQRERSYWYELLRPTRDTKGFRRQFQQSIESCLPAVKLRGGLPATEGEVALQEARVGDHGTLWLVPYNLACYFAIRSLRPGSPDGSDADVAQAVGLLETAVERPGSYQLTWAWASTDPDLDALRHDDRFMLFLDRLPRDRVHEEGGSIEPVG